jgi:hypothetical protein
MSIPAVRVCSVPGPPAWMLEQRERALRPDTPPFYADGHQIICSSGEWRQIQAPTELSPHLGVYFYNVSTMKRTWHLPTQPEKLYQDPVPQPLPHKTLVYEMVMHILRTAGAADADGNGITLSGISHERVRELIPKLAKAFMLAPNTTMGMEAQEIVADMIRRLSSTLARTIVASSSVGIGDRVVLIASGKHGTVRYFGEMPPFKGDWVGVEMDEPCGNCDGRTVGGVYHFRCAKNQGLYIRPNCLSLSSSTAPPPEPEPEPEGRVIDGARAAAEGVAAVNRAASKVDDLDAVVRAELAAEAKDDLAPMTDEDEPMPTGGPPAESAPAPAPKPVQWKPTELLAPGAQTNTQKRTRKDSGAAQSRPGKTPKTSHYEKRVPAAEEAFNAEPSMKTLMMLEFIRCKAKASAGKLVYHVNNRAVTAQTCNFSVVSKYRDTIKAGSTQWDAYVEVKGEYLKRLQQLERGRNRAVLRSEADINRFFTNYPDLDKPVSLDAEGRALECV